MADVLKRNNKKEYLFDGIVELEIDGVVKEHEVKVTRVDFLKLKDSITRDTFDDMKDYFVRNFLKIKINDDLEIDDEEILNCIEGLCEIVEKKLKKIPSNR